MVEMKRKKQILGAGSVVGPWRLVEAIGQGGNGTVWRASQPDRDDVALKILHQMDEISYHRFQIEIETLLRNVDIDGIIPIVEYDLPENYSGHSWYAMPIAQSFKSHISGMSPELIVKEFIGLAEALRKLHSRGISHRDIKPANILSLNGRLCLSDFGLVKYPDRKEITPKRRDVGPKFTMAPEMRRFASEADGIPADVFSFAKTLWIALTGVELGFDGQYSTGTDLDLKIYLGEVYTTILDELISNCTQNRSSDRPNISFVIDKLTEWLHLIEDFERRNLVEWTEIMQILFPLGPPQSSRWTNVDTICAILNKVAKIPSLNHMFYPGGGGNTMTNVAPASEDGFIEIHAMGVYLVSPKQLTFESFSADSHWNYFRLESNVLPSIEYSDPDRDIYEEAFTEIQPGEYGPYYLLENSYYDREISLPKTARLVTRYIKGSFVIFSTRSPYNLETSTYDGRHNKMNEDEFRSYIERSALRSSRKTSPQTAPRPPSPRPD